MSIQYQQVLGCAFVGIAVRGNFHQTKNRMNRRDVPAAVQYGKIRDAQRFCIIGKGTKRHREGSIARCIVDVNCQIGIVANQPGKSAFDLQKGLPLPHGIFHVNLQHTNRVAFKNIGLEHALEVENTRPVPEHQAAGMQQLAIAAHVKGERKILFQANPASIFQNKPQAYLILFVLIKIKQPAFRFQHHWNVLWVTPDRRPIQAG